jgi:hypothetical protein
LPARGDTLFNYLALILLTSRRKKFQLLGLVVAQSRIEANGDQVYSSKRLSEDCFVTAEATGKQEAADNATDWMKSDAEFAPS